MTLGNCPADDGRGALRPFHGFCDMGAIERAAPGGDPPDRPVITAPAEGANVKSAVLSGTAEPGAQIDVRNADNGDQYGSGTAGGDGTWSVSLKLGGDGVYTVSVTASNAAGSSPTALRTFVFDTTPPATPTLDRPAADGSTVTLTGTASEETALVRVFDAGVVVGATTPGVGGAWTIVLNDVADGGHNYTPHAYDQAGNDATGSPRELGLDSTAPVITSGPTGVITANSAQFTFTPGGDATFVCQLVGHEPSASKCASGVPYGTLANGTYTFKVWRTYLYGRSAAATRTFTVDATAPEAPVVTTSGEQGPNFTLTGSAEPASTVSIFEGDTKLGEATAASDGTWSFPISGAAPGQHAYSASARDAAGRESARSSVSSVHVAPAVVVAQQTPTPAPTAPRPRRCPPPVVNQDVNVVPAPGTTVLIKLPGHEQVRAAGGGPAAPGRHGDRHHARPRHAHVSAVDKSGKTQTADFYDGIFKVTQSKGVTVLTLTEALSCPKAGQGVGRGREEEDAAPLGQRQGQLPHDRQIQRGDDPRHHLAHAGHLYDDGDQGHPGRRLGQRFRGPQDVRRQAGQAAYRPRAQALVQSDLTRVPVVQDHRCGLPTRGAIRYRLAVAFAAFGVLAIAAASARAQDGGATLDSAPLHIYADGLGGLQVHADGVAGGLFYDPDESPGHAGLEIKEGASYYPLQDGFSTAPGRGATAPITFDDDGAGTKVMHSAYKVGPDLQVTEDVKYTAGTQFFDIHYGIQNVSGAPVSARAGALADLYVGNHDTGNGVISDVAPRFVGGQDTASGLVYGLQEFTPWRTFQEGDFESVFDNFADAGLNNTVDSGAPDNGVGVDFALDNIAPGEVRGIDVRWLMASSAPPGTHSPPPITPVTPPTLEQLPAPVAGKTVNVSVRSGKILVKIPPSKTFVELTDPRQIPVGATVDARKGKINLVSAADKSGKTQTGYFYDGIFKIGQTKGSKPVTTLTLVEELAKCPKAGKASASAKKPKTRRLWGSGKGNFRRAAGTARRRSGGRNGSSPIAAACTETQGDAGRRHRAVTSSSARR